MAANTEKVLSWLKDFKHTWLFQHILNDPQLINLISKKIDELERLLTQDHENDNEGVQTDSLELVVPSTEQQSLSSSVPSNVSQSVEKQTSTTEKPSTRPAILIKRIPLNEAEQYLPAAYRTPKSKRGRKRKDQNSTTLVSQAKKAKDNVPTVQSPSTEVEIAIQPNNIRRSTRPRKLVQPSSLPPVPSSDEKKKPRERKKLRAMDAEDDDLVILGNLNQTDNFNGQNGCEHVSRYLGQNGILSQTRKNNETTYYSDDFPLQLSSRQSKKKISNGTPNIEFNPPPPHVGNISSIEAEAIIDNIFENPENDSLFAALEMTNENPSEPSSKRNDHPPIDYTDCIEDISDDELNPPPPPPPPPSSSSPNINQLPVIT